MPDKTEPKTENPFVGLNGRLNLSPEQLALLGESAVWKQHAKIQDIIDCSGIELEPEGPYMPMIWLKPNVHPKDPVPPSEGA